MMATYVEKKHPKKYRPRAATSWSIEEGSEVIAFSAGRRPVLDHVHVPIIPVRATKEEECSRQPQILSHQSKHASAESRKHCVKPFEPQRTVVVGTYAHEQVLEV
jgi:hypothetical protein